MYPLLPPFGDFFPPGDQISDFVSFFLTTFFGFTTCFAAYRVFSKSAWRKTREHCKGKEEKEGMNLLECV